MGIHEWLLKHGEGYAVSMELRKYLQAYEKMSQVGGRNASSKLGLRNPKKYRAIAPTGTIGILASTTTGIEPMFAVAYKRRYLTNGTKWNHEYVVDATAETIIQETGIDPDTIETASELAKDPERRIAFQAQVQEYVDMGISSTINLPPWGTRYNNGTTAQKLARTIRTYAPHLRGLAVYPDGSRGGQPLEAVSYQEAKSKEGMVFDETEEKCKGGICGI
jgi:ribonucleoside-diphosphate reductase alpha chain